MVVVSTKPSHPAKQRFGGINKKITKKTELCGPIARQKGCKSYVHAYNLQIKQVGRQSSASGRG